MTINAHIVGIVLWLVVGLARADVIVGQLSNDPNDSNGYCYATVFESGKLITNYHCIINDKNEFYSDIYFHYLNNPPVKLHIPPSIKSREILDVDDIANDKVILPLSINISNNINLSCKNFDGRLYLPKFIDKNKKYCIAKQWGSGIFTMPDCALNRGMSGLPLFSNAEKTELCSIYTMTIINYKNNKRLGVSLKVEDYE